MVTSTEDKICNIYVTHPNILNNYETLTSSKNTSYIALDKFVYILCENKIIAFEFLDSVRFNTSTFHSLDGAIGVNFKVKKIFDALSPNNTFTSVFDMQQNVTYSVDSIITHGLYVYYTIERTFYSKLPNDYTGRWINFYKNSHIKKSEGSYENGLESGNWIFYNNDGTVNTQGICVPILKCNSTIPMQQIIDDTYDASEVNPDWEINGQQIGTWKYYDDRGIHLMTKEWLNNDICNVMHYYDNGNILTQQRLVNGLNEGEDKRWDINGTLLCLNMHMGENGIYMKNYDVNGLICSEGKQVIIGTNTGLWKYYNRGNISHECIYDNGELHGKYIVYYYANVRVNNEYEFISYVDEHVENQVDDHKHDNVMNNLIGNVRFEVNYHKHEKHGESTEYHPNETIKLKGSFNEDKKQGEWIEYYPNNNKKSQGMYDKNLWQGEWHFWYPDGKIKKICNYIDGKRKGKCIKWHDNGQKKYEGIDTLYYPDAPPIELSEWREDGTLYTKCTNDGKIATAIEYYPNGVMRAKINFIVNTVIRVKKYDDWYDNKNLKTDGQYNNNKKYGTWKYYKKDGSLRRAHTCDSLNYLFF
jgi:antitoxin component YwqK of YwqJK toxin-antitoxin module